MKYKEFLSRLTNAQVKKVKKALRKQKWTYSILAVIILLGIGLISYPSAASWWASVEQAKEVKAYSESVYDHDVEAIRAAAEAWNESLYKVKTKEEELEYYNTLCVGDDRPCVIGRVSVPVADIDLPVYHTVSLDTLLKGVGHLSDSHLPIGGESRHSILSAHTGLPSAKMFDNLVKVEEGDMIYITVLGEVLAYKVYATDVIDPDDLASAELLTMKPGKDLLTLITCTPYSVNSHRFVVSAERTHYDPETDKLYDRGSKVECLWCWFIPTVSALILLEGGNLWLYRRSRKKVIEAYADYYDIHINQ